MTISANPTLREIQTEFGGSASLRNYYRGGSYVDINASSSISTDPSSLTIRQFANVTKIVTLYSGTIYGYLAQANDSGTTGFGNPLGYALYYGWWNNNGTSPSPTTLSDGKTLVTFANYYHYAWTGGSNYSIDYQYGLVEVSGFGSDPGSSYLTSASLGGVTRTPQTYAYGGGQARWEFNGLFSVGQTGSYAGYIFR